VYLFLPHGPLHPGARQYFSLTKYPFEVSPETGVCRTDYEPAGALFGPAWQRFIRT
jgi:hypothetical protein